MVEDKNYELGSRIKCDGCIGTVKYVGTVGNTKGEWLGVDWDDPQRGKHNGTYEDVEYFTTWHPTSGSFIRLEKATFGISCPCAIKSRYGLINDELVGIDQENVISLQKEINAPFLEMVGFSKVNKKQSKFDQLQIVWLRDQCVSSAGMPGELRTLCPNLHELDISRNLINSWEVVADICVQLRFLGRLNISENKLPVEEMNIDSLKESFPSVNYLTMAKMNYDWSNVQQCIRLFPVIQELSISANLVDTLDIPIDALYVNRLKSLTLERNLIQDWHQVLKLGSLPCLECLNLNENKIHSISFPTEAGSTKTNLFPHLKQLHISKNHISEWQSVNELDKLVNLEELKFRENPVLSNGTVEDLRQMVIARISKLKFLNGTEIFSAERRGAENDYLKLFAKQWLETEKDPMKRSKFSAEHPRYPMLIQKYGCPDLHTPKLNAGMVSNVISVEFLCPNDPNQSQKIKRKLLKDMEVQKVVGLVQRLFKTHGKIPMLSCVSRKLENNEIHLDKPLQNLNYYSVQDGDQILVRW